MDDREFLLEEMQAIMLIALSSDGSKEQIAEKAHAAIEKIKNGDEK